MPDKTPNLLGGIGEAFADRNFRIYSVGSIGSWTSFFIQLVAVGWLTWQLTGSTTWLATMALLDIVPNVVLMPLTGALADRYDRYTIMLITAALALIQAATMALLAWWGMLTIWPLAILVLLHGIIISFMVPAMYGTLPRFVDRSALPSAIAVSSAYTQFAVFAGPALGGWIIAKHSLTMAFAVNALGYAILLLAFLCLKTPPDFRQPEPSSRSIAGDIIDGFAYISRSTTISSLLSLMLVTGALTSGFFHMMPAYSDLLLDQGIVGVSTTLACAGLGATAAALWLAHGGAGAARVERALWSSLIAILALAALVHTTNLYLAALIAGLMGFAGETRKTSTMSIIQLTVDENQRGRIMGTMFMMSQLAAGIGAFLIGSFAVDYGLKLPTTIGVAIGTVIWLAIYIGRKRLIEKPKD